MSLSRFIIAGERRCGTTSLYHWMSCHPDVWLHPKPDLNYFTEHELVGRRWIEGSVDARAWEEAHQPSEYAELLAGGADRVAAGHKGADLLFWRPAHARIARFAPGARLIVTLRDPVKRAWSQYWNEVGKGREDLPFMDAVEAEEERTRRSDYALFHQAYIRRGFYAESLRALYEHVPREQVMVLVLEELFSDPASWLGRAYDFIGVDSSRGLDRAGSRYNENWTMVPREWARRGPVRSVALAWRRVSEAAVVRLTREAETRRRVRRTVRSPFWLPASGITLPVDIATRLQRLYAPHVEATEELLGRPLPWRGRRQ